MGDLGVGVAVIFPALDFGFLGDHLHEQHHGDEHADSNGCHQVKHNSEGEREQKCGHRALRCRVAQVREIAPAAHVVGDLQQDCRDGGHGDERRVRHEEHEHCEQDQCVHHAGNRCAPAAFHVGGRARDGARRGNPAEEHRAQVAHALGHKLHVAAVMRADHGVGDDAREQRFDSGEDGDGDAVGQLVAQQVERELRHMQLGQAGVDGVKITDGAHVHAEQRHHDHAYDDGDKRAGHLGSQRTQSRPQKQHREAHCAHDERLPIEGSEVCCEGRYFVGRFDRHCARGIRKPEEVFQLADHDGRRNSRREAGGDGVGHESDNGSQLEQAHDHEQNAGD